MPLVGRDLHNVIVPVDLSNVDDVMLAIKQIQTFIKRTIPVRFGIVPTSSSPEAESQLKVAHYLQETFGLGSLIQYLEKVSTVQSHRLFLK